jgi:hypothetical protein
MVPTRSRTEDSSAIFRRIATPVLLSTLVLVGPSRVGEAYTICSGKALDRTSAARGTIGYRPMENLKSKLNNQDFFGEMGSVAPDALQFAAPLSAITTEALELAGCDIWFSGDDINWSHDEQLALRDWLHHDSEQHFVIGACNGPDRGEVCRAVGLPAEAFESPLQLKSIILSATPGGFNNPLRCAPPFCCTLLNSQVDVTRVD